MDILTHKQRSLLMSKIGPKDTKPEIMVRKRLYALGYRYRTNYSITGKPDIVFPKSKKAIFINGCFWHQHTHCNLSFMPKTNKEFWKSKFEANKIRDKKVISNLKKSGWTVLIAWECDIENNLNEVILNLTKKL